MGRCLSSPFHNPSPLHDPPPPHTHTHTYLPWPQFCKIIIIYIYILSPTKSNKNNYNQTPELLNLFSAGNWIRWCGFTPWTQLCWWSRDARSWLPRHWVDCFWLMSNSWLRLVAFSVLIELSFFDPYPEADSGWLLSDWVVCFWTTSRSWLRLAAFWSSCLFLTYVHGLTRVSCFLIELVCFWPRSSSWLGLAAFWLSCLFLTHVQKLTQVGCFLIELSVFDLRPWADSG